MGCGNFKKPRGVYKYEFICKINCFMNELGVKLMVVVRFGLNISCGFLSHNVHMSQCTPWDWNPRGMHFLGMRFLGILPIPV